MSLIKDTCLVLETREYVVRGCYANAEKKSSFPFAHKPNVKRRNLDAVFKRGHSFSTYAARGGFGHEYVRKIDGLLNLSYAILEKNWFHNSILYKILCI